MARKSDVEKLLLIGAGTVVVFQILAAQPNCNRGCKTMLEHLTQHVLDDVLSRLLLS